MLFHSWKIWLLLLVLTPAHSARSAESVNHFDQANRLYEQRNYAEAISLYESMVRAGRNSSGVFFNLGNAYFKNGDLGRAILNYRRAEALSPRDPDIQANLRFARDQVQGSVSIQRDLWRRFLTYFTLNELAVSAAMLFWIWLLLLSLVRYRPSLTTSLRPFNLTSGLLLAVTTLLLLLACLESRTRVAVITSEQVTVHLGPLSESQTAFTVTDGTELRLEAERDDWLQIADRSNRTGWIEKQHVAVYPK